MLFRLQGGQSRFIRGRTSPEVAKGFDESRSVSAGKKGRIKGEEGGLLRVRSRLWEKGIDGLGRGRELL